MSRSTHGLVVAICLGVTFLSARPAAAAAAAWAPNTYYALKQQAVYAGITYEARQAHTSQTGWEPPNVPALWLRVADTQPPSPWVVQRAYPVGEDVYFQEKLYRCRQAHVSQADWTPPVTPALWSPVTKVTASREDPFARILFESDGSNGTRVFDAEQHARALFRLSRSTTAPDWDLFQEGLRALEQASESIGGVVLLVTQARFTATEGGTSADRTFFMTSFSRPSTPTQDVTIVTSPAYVQSEADYVSIDLDIDGQRLSLPRSGQTAFRFASRGEKRVDARVGFADGSVGVNSFRFSVAP